MRIAFTGAHRVGKTTLAESLADSLPNYNFINEPYIQLEELGYLFSAIPTADDYIQQFNHSIKQTGTVGSDVLLDRCPLDLLAYVYATDKGRNIKTDYQDMTKAMSRIDLLVLVPIEAPDLIRCQQSDLPALRTEVDELVQKWLIAK